MLHSTHSPWRPPDYFEGTFESPYAVFEYTDWAVGKFFAALEEEGLLDETIVLLTADHTSLPVRDLSHFDHMNIPLIIYDGDGDGEKRWTVASQVDIMPTILGLLGLDVPYAAMGRNLLRVPEDAGFAASVYNGYAYWYEDRWLLKDWLDDSSPAELYDRTEPVSRQRDLAAELPGVTASLRERFRSYYQTARTLSLEDRIFPLLSSPAGVVIQSAGPEGEKERE